MLQSTVNNQAEQLASQGTGWVSETLDYTTDYGVEEPSADLLDPTYGEEDASSWVDINLPEAATVAGNNGV